jgi:hypothetical protein
VLAPLRLARRELLEESGRTVAERLASVKSELARARESVAAAAAVVADDDALRDRLDAEASALSDIADGAAAADAVSLRRQIAGAEARLGAVFDAEPPGRTHG